MVVKRYVERFDDVSDEECLAISSLLKNINTVIQKLKGPSSYLLLQKNGRVVRQSVPHVYVHYIPKKVSNNQLSAFGMLWNFLLESFQRQLSKEKLAEYVGVICV